MIAPIRPLTPARHWRVRGRDHPLDRPLVMGVLNVTPDSFSDGGLFLSPDAAVAHGERLVAEGADILDIGGESTRPQGAVPVEVDEELRRVLPVLSALRRRLPDTLLSVDTVKSTVARAALDAGADIVNDVSGLRLDPAIANAAAAAGAGLILMHSRGGVAEMATYVHAGYGRLVDDVIAELERSVARAREAGVAEPAIAVDPGIGFSKRSGQSLAVLRDLHRLAGLGHPVVVGVSRKRFIGEITGVHRPAERVHGSVGACVMAFAGGARIFRVHDVAAARQALDVAWRIMIAEEES